MRAKFIFTLAMDAFMLRKNWLKRALLRLCAPSAQKATRRRRMHREHRFGAVAQVEFLEQRTLLAGQTILLGDFEGPNGEASDDGFTIDNGPFDSGPLEEVYQAGLWHLSTGRGNDLGHSATHSMYYGQGEGLAGGGNYDAGKTAGSLISPVVEIPARGAVLSFNYLLEREPGTSAFDKVSVSISTDGGVTYQPVDLTFPSTTGSAFKSVTVDLDQFIGQSIQIKFTFDTADSVNNQFEGWYIDDVLVQGKDFDDQISEATPSTLGSMFTGVIDSNSDVDFYSFTAYAGQTLTFDIDRPPGGTLDSYLRLFTVQGVELLANNDGSNPLESSSTESFLTYTFPATGTYYMGVSGNGNSGYDPLKGDGDSGLGSTGEYIFSIGDPTDPDDAINEALPINVNTPVDGIIGNADVDMYAVNVLAGQTLFVDIDLPEAGLNPYLRLFNVSGNQLAMNDDGPNASEPTSLESFLTYTFAAAGTYYIGVSASGNPSPGDAVPYDAKSGLGDVSGKSTGKYTLTANLNVAPNSLALSKATLPENRPVGTIVGTFSATDANEGSTFTYMLAAGTGSTDNGSFTIVGNQLKTNAVFNYEAKSSYSIRVRVTDNGGLTLIRIFTITVTNVKEAPTALALTSTSVTENKPVGTAVGTFTASDPNADSTFTYMLAAGAGDTNNGSFTIAGNQLKTNAVFNYEAKSSYSIRVRVTDNGGLTFIKIFTITVTNVKEAPTSLALTSTSVAENQPVGTVVGTFSAIDQDAGSSLTYMLAAGTGDADNGSFTIVGNQLRTNAVFDYEVRSSYSIRVRVTDNSGLTLIKIFTISVTNLNEAPTAIALSSTSVNENRPVGTVVGTFSATDPDAGSAFTYMLAAGTGDTNNGSFTIVGNQLRTNAVFNDEAKSSYSIRVRVTDNGGLTLIKIFTISIVDVAE